jgi:hypothetical protein
MNTNETNIIIHDTIDADQIEIGDQILVDGDPIEVDDFTESESDDSEVIVYGFSHESGDRVTISLPYDYRVDLWSV